MKRIFWFIFCLLSALVCRGQTLPGSPPWVLYVQPVNLSSQPLPNRLCKIAAYGPGISGTNNPVVQDVGQWYTDASGYLYITNPVIPANYVVTVTAPPQQTQFQFTVLTNLTGNLQVTNTYQWNGQFWINWGLFVPSYAQSPWIAPINGNGQQLTNVGNIQATGVITGAAVTGGVGSSFTTLLAGNLSVSTNLTVSGLITGSGLQITNQPQPSTLLQAVQNPLALSGIAVGGVWGNAWGDIDGNANNGIWLTNAVLAYSARPESRLCPILRGSDGDINGFDAYGNPTFSVNVFPKGAQWFSQFAASNHMTYLVYMSFGGAQTENGNPGVTTNNAYQTAMTLCSNRFGAWINDDNSSTATNPAAVQMHRQWIRQFLQGVDDYNFIQTTNYQPTWYPPCYCSGLEGNVQGFGGGLYIGLLREMYNAFPAVTSGTYPGTWTNDFAQAMLLMRNSGYVAKSHYIVDYADMAGGIAGGASGPGLSNAIVFSRMICSPMHWNMGFSNDLYFTNTYTSQSPWVYSTNFMNTYARGADYAASLVYSNGTDVVAMQPGQGADTGSFYVYLINNSPSSAYTFNVTNTELGLMSSNYNVYEVFSGTWLTNFALYAGSNIVSFAVATNSVNMLQFIPSGANGTVWPRSYINGVGFWQTTSDSFGDNHNGFKGTNASNTGLYIEDNLGDSLGLGGNSGDATANLTGPNDVTLTAGSYTIDFSGGAKWLTVTGGNRVVLTNFDNCFGDTTNAVISGGTHGVTNTTTKYGTAIIVASSSTFTLNDSANNTVNTFTSVTGTFTFPVGPNSSIQSSGGSLSSAKVVFQ